MNYSNSSPVTTDYTLIKSPKKTVTAVKKALKNFSKLIQKDYTHENFSEIAEEIKVLNPHLALEELKSLEEIWRDSYTEPCDETVLKEAITNILIRFS